MRIPKSFMLAGNRWRVRLVPKKMLRHDDGEYVLGVCLPVSKQIYIHKRLSPDLKLQVFMHECAHAILFTMGHVEEHNEVMIEAVAQLVYQLITTGEDNDTNQD